MLGRTNAVSGKPTQTKTVEFNPGSANSITITPDQGYLLSAVEVGKPATMIPSNIKSGIDIGGVVGTFEGGVNTSDATATSNDILLGKTAYANNEKIVGTIPTYNNEHENGYVSTNTLKKLLDTTKKAHNLFYFYGGDSVDDLISYNDTEFVTDMQGIFYYCTNIKSLPLLNTSNVTIMRDAFYFCSYYLQNIPLYDTSNVTDMRSAFAYCTQLKEIPALNVSNVTKFNGAFYECSGLTRIHMTGMKVSFDISSCIKLKTEALHEIIDNLANVTSTQTLTMGSALLAKVSEEYKAIATNKGWTLA